MKKEFKILWEVNKEAIKNARKVKEKEEEKKIMGVFEEWYRLRERRKEEGKKGQKKNRK